MNAVTTVQKKHNSITGNSDIQVHVSDFLTNPVNLNSIAANTSKHPYVFIFFVRVMGTVFTNKSTEII